MGFCSTDFSSTECPDIIFGTHFYNDKCVRRDLSKKNKIWDCISLKTLDDNDQIIPFTTYMIKSDEIHGWVYWEAEKNFTLASHPRGNCPPKGKWENIHDELHGRQSFCIYVKIITISVKLTKLPRAVGLRYCLQYWYGAYRMAAAWPCYFFFTMPSVISPGFEKVEPCFSQTLSGTIKNFHNEGLDSRE